MSYDANKMQDKLLSLIEKYHPSYDGNLTQFIDDESRVVTFRFEVGKARYDKMISFFQLKYIRCLDCLLEEIVKEAFYELDKGKHQPLLDSEGKPIIL